MRFPRSRFAIAMLVGWLGFVANVAQGESPTPTGTTPTWTATGKTMMVATDHPQASRIGLEVLRRGGNAIDAACAVSFALGVTRPQSTGLGGGGFLIVRIATSGDVHVFDFREMAPSQATPNMFERARETHPTLAPPSRYDHLAVAVPGLLAGMFDAHKALGTTPMAKLIAPAIELAERGVKVDRHYVEATEIIAERFEEYPELKKSCAYVYRVHLRSGNPRVEGELLRQPELANLLRSIASKGSAAFYEGPVAKAFAESMKAHGGILNEQDLRTYRVIRRKPMLSTYRGYDIITMPPPSSGGVCLIETLNILETVDLRAMRQADPSLAMHHQIEAMKRAFADRATWLADTDFADVPIARLTSKAYAENLAKQIRDRATPVVPNVKQIANDSGTSHYSIVDRWGNCVVATETINTTFGSLAAIDAYGLILNNEMDDFSAERGRANVFALTQSDRNAVEPHKRPLSSMSPTIILKDGKLVLALGGSGGPRIISSVVNVIVNVLDFDMPLKDAIRATRIHHQWMPDRVVSDRDLESLTAKSLRDRGHVIDENHKSGIVQAIHWTQKGIVGASDPRKYGQPRGE